MWSRTRRPIPGISIWLEAFSGFGDLSDDGTAALEAGEDDDFG